MRHKLSENEKVIWFAILFPIFWPFLPVILLCVLFENIGHKYRAWKWDRQARPEKAG